MQVSRRQFLKVASVTICGTAAYTILGLSRGFTDMDAATQSLASSWDEALAISRNAPMFQETISELDGLDLRFDVSEKTIRQTSFQDRYIGLVMKQTDSQSPRMGADLVLTIDLASKTLNVVQRVVGWSLLDTLQVSSVIFDARDPLYEEWRNPRIHYDIPPRMIRPRLERLWSVWRPDSPLPRPEDLVELGWPLETPDSHYWHYGGCSDCVWVADREAWVYRCVQVLEERSGEVEQRRTVDLDYNS
jgi:hypothetical protein